MNRPLVALFTGLTLTGAATAQPETWKIDAANSAAQFAVKHLTISTVRGNFTKFAGTVQYDPIDVSKTSVEVTFATDSLNTHLEARDNDLRSEKYFDVKKYPTMTFKSKHTEQAGPGKLKIAGDLTLHGVTKEVVLNVEGPSPEIKDAKGLWRRGASATASLDRADFGMTRGQPLVGSEVAITIDVELIKPTAANN